jgi:hypothetical protein
MRAESEGGGAVRGDEDASIAVYLVAILLSRLSGLKKLTIKTGSRPRPCFLGYPFFWYGTSVLLKICLCELFKQACYAAFEALNYDASSTLPVKRALLAVDKCPPPLWEVMTRFELSKVNKFRNRLLFQRARLSRENIVAFLSSGNFLEGGEKN